MLQYVDCAHNWKDGGLSGDYCTLMTDMGLENLMPGTSAFMANITQIFCRSILPRSPLPTASGQLAEISAS